MENINYFIDNLKNVEKLNKTNLDYINYKKKLEYYVQNNYYSQRDIINKLTRKSSCLPFLLNKFLSKKQLKVLIKRMNLHIYTHRTQYLDIEGLINYMLNIVSINELKNIFVYEFDNINPHFTIFSYIFSEGYEELNKFNSSNQLILKNIFLKIFDSNKCALIFLNSIEEKEYRLHDKISNYVLNKKDIFYKHLIMTLIEIFNCKYSYHIKSINSNKVGFVLFKKIFNLIELNYINIIDEIGFINGNVNDVFNVKKFRLDFIYNILNNFEYKNYVCNFLSMCMMWLTHISNFDRHLISSESEFVDRLTKTIYNFYNYNFDYQLINNQNLKYYEKIFQRKITKNKHMLLEHLYFVSSIVSNFSKNNIKYKYKYKFFDFYLSKVVKHIPSFVSFLYDKFNNEENYKNEILGIVTESCNLLNYTIFIHPNYRKIFNNFNSKNDKLIKKLVCILLENTNLCCENMKGTVNNNNLDILLVNYYHVHIVSLLFSINNFCIHYRDYIFSKELKELFITVFNNILTLLEKIENDKIFENIENIENINSTIELKYDDKQLINLLKQIILNSKIVDKLFYNESIVFLKKKLIDYNLIKVSELFYLNKIISKYYIINLNKLNNLDKDSTKEIPSELCDPITSILIEIPVMLPNNVIVDKSMIYRYLLTNKINPFDRQPLTITMLDEYNKIPEVQNKINDFSKMLEEYKVTINENF